MVAALVIRDAVGDAISRQQAAVKPGPWPGRRAAGEALSWDLVGPLGGLARYFQPAVGTADAVSPRLAPDSAREKPREAWE